MSLEIGPTARNPPNGPRPMRPAISWVEARAPPWPARPWGPRPESPSVPRSGFLYFCCSCSARSTQIVMSIPTALFSFHAVEVLTYLWPSSTILTILFRNRSSAKIVLQILQIPLTVNVLGPDRARNQKNKPDSKNSLKMYDFVQTPKNFAFLGVPARNRVH